jgi:ATP-dependent Clp protease ATP-binding subunit ClpC
LVRERDCRGACILEHLGLSLNRVQYRIELLAQRAPDTGPPIMVLSPEAKRVIDHALREARQLGDQYVGTEHLLLGLLQEGLAARVLHQLGASPERVRRALEKV